LTLSASSLDVPGLLFMIPPQMLTSNAMRWNLQILPVSSHHTNVKNMVIVPLKRCPAEAWITLLIIAFSVWITF
jgi:hypothetical protein